MNSATIPKTTTLQYVCPYCSAKLQIREEFAGINAPCPNCRAPLTAPSFNKTPLKSLPRPEDDLPVEKRFNETPEQPEFSDRIVNPNIGVQSPSEEQQRNIQNAPPLTARPRPARRPDNSDIRLPNTSERLSGDKSPLTTQESHNPAPFSDKITPAPPRAGSSLADEEVSERNFVIMSHKKDLEGCIKLLTACIYKLEHSDLLE